MTTYAILFMDAISPVHNGAGTSIGLIDNPIIRERSTDFPFIQASTVKGVLRDILEKNAKNELDQLKIKAVFGPPPNEGSEHAGAVSFGEGEIFAFPIRSLKGSFVWAMSPLILHRLFRKFEIMYSLQTTNEIIESIKSLISKIDSSNNQVLICKSAKSSLLVSEKLILEEFAKITIDSQQLEDFSKIIAQKIFGEKNSFPGENLKKKLVILPDDSFAYFIRNATEIRPNIRIGEKGTAEDGSLRYTEYLPSETILYSFLTFEKARVANSNELELDTPEKVKTFFIRKISEIKHIQVGGDETTGKGLVHIKCIEE